MTGTEEYQKKYGDAGTTKKNAKSSPKTAPNLPAHARGFVCNADALTLLRFIQFGSSAAMPDRMSA